MGLGQHLLHDHAQQRTPGDSEAGRRRIPRGALAWSVATSLLSLLALGLFFTAVDSTGRSIAYSGRFGLVQNLCWVTDAGTQFSSLPRL